MTQEHWFDVMSKVALRAATRRGVVRSVAVLLPSLLVSSMAGSAAGKKTRGKKKSAGGKGGKKKKGNKDTGIRRTPGQGNGAARPGELGPPAPEDQCVELSRHGSAPPELISAWQSDCREICAQCPEDFCIYINNWDLPDDSVTAMCCPSPKTCCPEGCFDLRTDRDHCGQCVQAACGAGEVCRDSHCVCEGAGCPHVCRSADCPGAQGCVTSRGYLCEGSADPDCQCGCGPGLKHCHEPQQGWLCVSENATIC